MRDLDSVRDYLTGLQDRICAAIEGADGGARFIEDAWTREPGEGPLLGGGGRTRILRDGAVFEQAGIGFSDVSGNKLPPSATAARPELNGAAWRAMGVSLVFHPSYSYENFVLGVFPSATVPNAIEVVPGPLLELAHYAEPVDHQGFLIIDEFNRGRAAAIFGDAKT